MVDFNIVVKVDPNPATAGTRVVKRKLDRLEQGAVRLRRQLATMFAPLAAGAVLVGATRTLASFSQEMSTVLAITQATEVQFAQLTDTARELGATTRFSATQAAEGMVFLARAGFETEEVLASVGDTLLLAQSGALSLGSAADIASNVLQGFRLEVSETARVVDVLSFTANNANTNVLQLGDAMKFVAPVASGVGLSIEVTAAAMGALSDAGLQASLAGTGLRRVLSELESPSVATNKVLQSLGLNLDDVRISSVGLVQAMQNLKTAGVDTGLALQIFGDRGGPAFEVLSSSIPKVIKMTEELQNADGTAESIAKTMDDNLNGALLGLRSRFQELILAFGAFGATGGLETSIRALSEGFVILAENVGTVTVALLALTARAITPLVAAAIPAFISGIGTAATALQLFTVSGGAAIVVSQALQASLTFLGGPVGAALVGLTLVVGAFTLGIFDAEDATEALTKDTVSYSNALASMVQFIAPATTSIEDYTEAVKQATIETRQLEEQQLQLSRTNLTSALEGFEQAASNIVGTIIPLNNDMRSLQDTFIDLANSEEDLSGPLREYISVIEQAIAASPGREQFLGPVLVELRQLFIDIGGASSNLDTVNARLAVLAKLMGTATEETDSFSQIVRDFVLETSNENAVLALSTKLLAENSATRLSQIAALEVAQELGRELTQTEKDALIPLLQTNEELARREQLLQDIQGPQEDLNQRIRDIIPLLGQSAEMDAALNRELLNTVQALRDVRIEAGEGTFADGFLSELDRMTEGARNASAQLGTILAQPLEQLSAGLGDAAANAIVFGEDFSAAMRQVGADILSTVISSLVQLGVQMLINATLGRFLAAAATEAAVAEAAVVGAAWATPAALVSAATFGASAVAGTAALTASVIVAQGLAAATPGFAHGGQFTVGGRAGVDQNLVPLRLSKGEDVLIRTPQQKKESERGGGGITIGSIVVEAPGAAIGAAEEIRDMLVNEFIPEILEQAREQNQQDIVHISAREPV